MSLLTCLQRAEACLNVLEAGQPDPPALSAAADSFAELYQELESQFIAAEASHRREVERLVERAATVLPQLGEQLRASLLAARSFPAARSSALQLGAGRKLLEGLAVLCGVCATSPAASVQLCHAARLLAAAGPAVLTVSLRFCSPAMTFHTAALSLGTMLRCLTPLHVLRMEGRLPQAAVAAFDAPQLLQWLVAVGGMLQRYLQTDSHTNPPLPVLTQVASAMLGLHELYAADGTLAAFDAAHAGGTGKRLLQLTFGVVRFALPMLRAAGTASGGAATGQQQQQQRQQQGEAWQLAASWLILTAALPCWREVLAGWPADDKYRSVLQLCADLLAGLPAERPAAAAPADFGAVQVMAANLPLMATGMLDPAGNPAGSIAEHAHNISTAFSASAARARMQPSELAAWLAERLAGACSTLRLLTGDAGSLLPPPDGQLKKFVSNLSDVLSGLSELPAFCDSCTTAQAAALARLADEGLQTLPCLAALHQRWRDPAAAGLPHVAARDCCTAAGGLAEAILDLWASFVLGSAPFLARQHELNGGSTSAAAAAAAAAQLWRPLWRVQSTACRLAHWSTSVAAQQARELACQLQGHFLAFSLSQLSDAMDMSVNLAASGPPDSEVAAARAQHWAALKALVQDWGPDPMAVLQGEEVTVRSSICRGVAKSASLCAVARDPLLPQVLLACLQGLQQQRREEFWIVCMTVLQAASHADAAAALASSGVLRQLVQGLEASQRGAGAAGDQVSIVHKQVLIALATLLDTSMPPGLDSAGADASQLQKQLQVCHATCSSAAFVQAAKEALPAAERVAAAVLEWWQEPEQVAAARRSAPEAAAGRSCAFLRCANLAGCSGGPAAGEGAGSFKCSACRRAWYCGTACSHADWKDHKRVCKAWAAEREEQRRQRQQKAQQQQQAQQGAQQQPQQPE